MFNDERECMNGTRADVFCAFVHIKGGTIESENSSSSSGSSKKFQSSTKEHDCRGSTEEWWRAVSSSHGIQRTRLAGRIVLRNHNIMSATEAKQSWTRTEIANPRHCIHCRSHYVETFQIPAQLLPWIYCTSSAAACLCLLQYYFLRVLLLFPRFFISFFFQLFLPIICMIRKG